MITRQKAQAHRLAGVLWLVVMIIIAPAHMFAADKSRAEQTLAVSAFKKLTIIDAGHKNTDVVIHIAEDYRMTISGCDAKKIRVEADNDSTLLVSPNGVEQETAVRIDVYAPCYKEIFTAFIHSLRSADQLRNDDLRINASETPDVNLSVQAKSLHVEADGAKVVLAGECENCDLTFYGFNQGNLAVLDASALQAKQMHLNCGVLNDVRVNVTDMLWIIKAIDSKIDVKGTPVVLENGMNDCELYMH